MLKTALINGDIWTMQNEKRKVQAVFIKDTKIYAIGTTEEIQLLCDETTNVIDLEGKTVLPGFIDAHMHLGWYISTLMQVDLRYPRVKSKEDLIQRLISETNEETQWIRGFGYDHNKLIEQNHPTKEDLDKVSLEKPIVLNHISGHSIAVNTKVLEICGINKLTEDPRDGIIERDDEGNPTGIFYEGAQNLVFNHMPATDKKELEIGLEKANKSLLSYGITSIHDMMTEDFETEFMCYFDALQRGKLSFRVCFFLPFPSYLYLKKNINQLDKMMYDASLHDNDQFKISGLKFFADGSLNCNTAAMYTPYKNSNGDCGIMTLEYDEIVEISRFAKNHQLQVSFHAIGERAVDTCAKAYSDILEVNNNSRFRIEHCGLINSNNLELMRDYNIYVASQPKFIDDFGEGFINNLECTEYKKIYAFSSLKKAGIHLGFSSDAAVTEIDPLPAIRSAIYRKTKEGNAFELQEKVSLYETIKSYTVEGAYGSFDENIKGKILPNFLADLVVLSNTLKMDTLDDIIVEKTILNGKVEYERQSQTCE